MSIALFMTSWMILSVATSLLAGNFCSIGMNEKSCLHSPKNML